MRPDLHTKFLGLKQSQTASESQVRIAEDFKQTSLEAAVN